MMRGMIRRLVAALALIAVPAAAQDAPPPATVVVAFDRDAITPLIVEGLANKESGRALEANDPVRIASISKLIMALTALRLMDEGKVDLDRDVSDYLGWKLRSPHHPDAPITLTHLLMHRAGLSDAGGYVIPLGESLEAKLADPAAWREVGPPGEAAFEYANLGSPLVATALEAASGERYDRLVERLVFAPLGVKACLNWIGCDADMQARAVTLYRHTGEVARRRAGGLPPPAPFLWPRVSPAIWPAMSPAPMPRSSRRREASGSAWSIWRRSGRRCCGWSAMGSCPTRRRSYGFMH